MKLKEQKIRKLKDQKGISFKEYLIKWKCNKCGNENMISVKNNMGYISGKQKNSVISAYTKFLPEIKCKSCKFILEKGSNVNIMMIEPPFFNKSVPFFEELFLQSYNYSEKDIEKSKKYLASIYGWDVEDISENNVNIQQLLKLIRIASNLPRCQESLRRFKKSFIKNVIPIYNNEYSPIFIGTCLFNGLISLIPGEDPRFYVARLVFKKEFNSLTENEQMKIYHFCINIKEIFCLQRLMEHPLFHGKGLQIHDIYNLLEKYDMFFKFLFKIQLVESKKNQLLEPYKRIRHAVAHSHYIYQDNQIKLVDWEYGKNKKNVQQVIGNYNKIAEEMLILVTIIAQIVATYQLFYQNRKKKKN